MKLAPYVLRRELDIEHGGVNVGVAHQPHEGRQRDAGAHHVGPESVSEAMRICLKHLGQTAVIAKHSAQAGRCEGLSAVWAFQHDEKERRARLRPFQTKVAIDQLDGLWIKGQKSFSVPFPRTSISL